MVEPHEGARLRQELGAWLEEWEWGWFATLTFDDKWGPTGPSPDRCLSLTREWCERRPGIPGYYLCVETGRGGRVHSHALLGDAWQRDAFGDKREEWHFGRDAIRRIDPERSASFYVAKYVTKSPDLWDIGGTMRRVRPGHQNGGTVPH